MRRAALRQALRAGRATEIVRAGDRLRLSSSAIGGRALLDIREARGRLGRAMRVARRRRALGNVAAAEAAGIVAMPAAVAIPARRLRRRWIVAAIVALVILGILLAFILWPRTEEDPGGGLPNSAPIVVITREVLRGKSVSIPTTPPIAAIVTPPPSALPSPTREPDEGHQGGGGPPAPGGVPGGTGSGTGGSGTGTGSGVGSGTASGTPRPTPKPTQPPLGSLAPGFGRFTVIVLDATTGSPLPDVCLIVGSGDCSPTKPHTDGAGRWTVDVPVQTPTTNWDIVFVYPPYARDFRRFTLIQGQTVTYVVRLTGPQPRD